MSSAAPPARADERSHNCSTADAKALRSSPGWRPLQRGLGVASPSFGRPIVGLLYPLRVEATPFRGPKEEDLKEVGGDLRGAARVSQAGDLQVNGVVPRLEAHRIESEPRLLLAR